MRIASDNARMGLPEVSLGVIPGYGGTQRLPQIVGKGKAMEMILTARMMDAEDAAACGLVNAVVPTDALLEDRITNGAIDDEELSSAASTAIQAVLAGYEEGINGFRAEINCFGAFLKPKTSRKAPSLHRKAQTTIFRKMSALQKSSFRTVRAIPCPHTPPSQVQGLMFGPNSKARGLQPGDGHSSPPDSLRPARGNRIASPSPHGLAFKHGITVLNSPGTIDADYRGEIGVLLINHGASPSPSSTANALPNLVLARYEQIEWKETENLPSSDRGTGGFGSTGTR
jgi:hypothetical protein